MARRLIFVIIAMLFILSACSKKQEGETYFPQGADGAQWEYGLRYSAPEGVRMGAMIIRIEGKETINGKKYYKQITLTSGIPGEGSHVSYNRRTKEGIYKIDENSKGRQEYLITPFPIKAGDSWSAQTSSGQTRYKAEKIETVEFDKIKYDNCLKVSFQVDRGGKHFEGFSYFAPEIGEVYSMVNLGEVKVDYALVKHKL